MKLKPCPFCGNEPSVYTCDILISIECKKCGYSRGFDGLLSIEKTKVVEAYDKNGEPSLWYHQDAYEKAENEWNTRYKE